MMTRTFGRRAKVRRSDACSKISEKEFYNRIGFKYRKPKKERKEQNKKTLPWAESIGPRISQG
jgi:hypothetical protein